MLWKKRLNAAHSRRSSLTVRTLRFETLERRALLSIGTGFDGIKHSDSQENLAPPDTIGAVGPNSFIEAVNNAVAIYDKTSEMAISGGGITSFRDFFRKPASEFGQFVTELDTADVSFTDPVVVYNDVTQQFAIGVLDFNRNASGDKTDSRFDFAISKGSDPRSFSTNDWDFFRFDTDDDPLSPDQTSYNVNFSDFPKIGYNADGFIVSFNMESATGFTHVAILDIASNGNTNGMRTILDGATVQGFSQLFTFAPASMHGSVPGDPMWFVHGGNPDDANDFITAVKLSTPFAAGSLNTSSTSIDVNDFHTTVLPLQPPDSPQGDPTSVGFLLGTRFYFSALRQVDGVYHLVAAHNVGMDKDSNDPFDPSDPDFNKLTVAVRWYDIELTTGVAGTPELNQQGTVNPATATIFTFMPSIEIAPDGTIGLNYLQSGPTQRLSMYVTAHRSSDADGQMQGGVPVAVSDTSLRAGSPRRVGDYSFISVDPVDGSFWAINEYARDDIADPNWGTWIQQFYFVPRVVDVTIRKDGAPGSNPAYHFATQTFGSNERVIGNGNQIRTVPVGGADTVEIRFSEDVTIGASDLSVIGLRTAHVLDVDENNFDYSPNGDGTFTAKWKLLPVGTSAAWPGNDNYVILLSENVADANTGEFLDGEWTNPHRLYEPNTTTTYQHARISEFPSGDGLAGGPFQFVVTMYFGDLNRNNQVTLSPDIFTALAAINMGFGMSWSDGDFSGNGQVTLTDDVFPALANINGPNLQVLFVLADFLDDDFLAGNEEYLAIQRNMNMTNAEREHGDINGDHVVNIADYQLLMTQFYILQYVV